MSGAKGRAKVQRETSEFPIVHLESEVPSIPGWFIRVDGLVETPSSWSLEELRLIQYEERVWDLNCVWGWTRPACRWGGISAAHLFDSARPLPGAAYVIVRAIQGPYASCFSLEEARRGFLAWRLDGEELGAERGGPLRFLPPPGKWAYKGVKWVGGMSAVEEFEPGFWEALVGDPRGDIPAERFGVRLE